ncbi:MAG: efflux RND transporter permease subunit [Proteobacteria bacterium]|nr:efflux RND transporter permease subunit [Pseudomonadota bacterium]
MPNFFIDRPVFAWVLAIITMMAGLLILFRMPVEQYPNIAAPAVSISTSLPGASAQVLENSVTQVIEQSLTGIDSLRYFSSSSDSDGNVSINISFEPGTNPNIAQVQVQNKLQTAMPLLPIEIQQQGVRIKKSNNNFLLVVSLYSKDDSVNEGDLGDLLLSDIKDGISRIDGVGDVITFGNPHAMRIWLNPLKLFGYNLTSDEVIAAIKAQNADVAAGQLGGLPAMQGQQLNATITSQSRLSSVADFENIIIRGNSRGAQILLKDIAKVEIGQSSYSTRARYKKHPASGMAVILGSGANALKTASAVKEKMAKLATNLPKGVEVIYPFDSTPFIKLSIAGVVETLVIAVILVFLVMLLFLQNFRATLIPTIAVPVVLLGTFAILSACGFTINTLTMFAVVLAIGLLVDDAIVVVENVERIMHEEGLSPKDATRKSMQQITGALIGIAMVLSAVFIPMAFFGGSAGEIYRQFSITIVSAMGLSVLVALILSPSLCATILKPVNKEQPASQNKFINSFNQKLDSLRNFYQNSSNKIIARSSRFLMIYVVMLGGLIFLFTRIPTSFLPNEDQGMMYLIASTPSGSSLGRTSESLEKIEDYFLKTEEKNIEHLFTVAGFSVAGRAQNAGFGFVGLKDWSVRKNPDQSVMAIAGRAMGGLSQIKDVTAFTFFPPPIRELGNASGFDLQVLDRGGLGHQKLMEARNQLLGAASQNPLLVGVRPNGLSDTAQYKLEINYKKAVSLGLSIKEINNTLQTALGSTYVNDFLDNGRIKRVYLQGDASYRMNPEDIAKWYVKNSSGRMVSFSSFTKGSWTFGSPKLERFNGSSSFNIQGAPAPGISTGTAMKEMEKLIKQLPLGIDFAWSGISYEEKKAGSQTFSLYVISLIVVFLSLAALYESWAIPFSVILAVPFGIFGALVTSKVTGMSNDVYFQVGLLTTIGLSAKNAILIIEFAKSLCDQGHEVVEATLIAVKLRFRPIIMTSMAFMLGIAPLAFASGAGSASQRAIGIGVMGGMFAATFFATLFVPLFFVLVQRITKRLTSN